MSIMGVGSRQHGAEAADENLYHNPKAAGRKTHRPDKGF